MNKKYIINILCLHNIPYYVKNGRIYTDSMIGDIALFDAVEDVTDWKKADLFTWLGY